jgi:tetratricopeptide (TPR) repeat protein
VYYILGRLSANTGKTDEALVYFRKGLASAKVTSKQKALTFAAIGNVYYDKNKYVEAKLAYDSAAILASHAPKDSSVKLAVKRSQKLSGITEPIRVIHEDDSLMALSKLTNKEQLSVVRKYIKRLESARSDSAFKAENAALNASRQSSSKANPNNPYSNWYFANSALVQQGINEFKRKWGSRQPVDNWARMSAISNFANKDNTEENKISESDAVDVVYDANGLPTEESLLAFIPNTDERKTELNGNIQQAYMDLAGSYINDFEEYGLAIQTLDTFDKHYPSTEYEAEALYLHYLAYMKQGKVEKAQLYAKKVAEKYADGKYADLVGHGATESTLTSNAGLAQYYDETYDLLLNRDNITVLARVKQAQKQFSDANYAKRFWIMEGIAMAGIDSFTYADSLVRDFISKYPKDSLRPWADAVLKYIADKKPKPAAVSPMTASPTATASPTSGTNPPAPPPLPNSPTGNLPSAEKAKYTYNASEPHYTLFTFNGMEPRTTAMRGAIADFNNSKFATLNLSAEIALLDGTSGVIVSKAFANTTEAKIYLNLLRGNTQVFKDYKPGEYELVMISQNNYEILMKSKDIKGYLIFYSANYK